MARKTNWSRKKRSRTQHPNGRDVFHGECILAEKVEKGETLYLLKYLGYGMEEAKWVPESYIGDGLLADWEEEKELLDAATEDGESIEESGEDEDGEDDDGKHGGVENDSASPVATSKYAETGIDPHDTATDGRDEEDEVEIGNATPRSIGRKDEVEEEEIADTASGGKVETRLDEGTDKASDENHDDYYDELLSLPNLTTDDTDMDDAFDPPLATGYRSPDFVNEPRPMPSLQDVLERDLDLTLGDSIHGTQVVDHIKGIDEYLPGRVLGGLS